VAPARTALVKTFESMSMTSGDSREKENAAKFNVFKDDGNEEEEVDHGPSRWPDFGIIALFLTSRI
jgi:hypothetical protein